MISVVKSCCWSSNIWCLVAYGSLAFVSLHIAILPRNLRTHQIVAAKLGNWGLSSENLAYPRSINSRLLADL